MAAKHSLVEPAVAKPPRRTQAERSAGTRARLLKATVTCLYRHGYGATTTVSVAATAKVSRGAMLHHFPSKADLMLATLDHVLTLGQADFSNAAAKVDDPWERYAALPDLRLAAARQPAGVAFMEIMVGARSDESVRLAKWAAASGVKVTPRDQADSHAIGLAVFGLAIEGLVNPGADSEEVLSVLRDLKRGAMEPA